MLTFKAFTYTVIVLYQSVCLRGATAVGVSELVLTAVMVWGVAHSEDSCEVGEVRGQASQTAIT